MTHFVKTIAQLKRIKPKTKRSRRARRSLIKSLNAEEKQEEKGKK